MQQPIYSVASRKILEIQVLRPFFKAFLSRIQVFHYFSSIFLFFTKGCGKCRCSIMGLVYLVVRKQMMEMVFLLTTTLLFLILLHTPPYGHPSCQRGMVCGVLKSQGISESRYVLGSWFYFMLRSQETSESGGKNRGLLFLCSVGTLGLQIENNV